MNFPSISRKLQELCRNTGGRVAGPGGAAEAADPAKYRGGGILEKLPRGSVALLIGVVATHAILIPMFRALRPAASMRPSPAQTAARSVAQGVGEIVAEIHRVPPQRLPRRLFRFPMQAPFSIPWTDASVTAGLDQLEALANDPLRKPPDEL